MSVRLRLASLWMPRYMMAREVERIRESTNATLDDLLAKCGTRPVKDGSAEGRSLEERRAAMARGHERRVRALAAAMGEEEAVRAARGALFKTGYRLGQDARRRLGVGSSPEDLVRAAGIMYRVLGIEFDVADTKEGGRLEVRRCALASQYSHLTCRALSAVDEGVVSGLHPRAGMRFSEHITGGAARCVANITFEVRP